MTTHGEATQDCLPETGVRELATILNATIVIVRDDTILPQRTYVMTVSEANRLLSMTGKPAPLVSLPA